MIIRYPTGLYNLFGSIEDVPNITWYMSSEAPPRSKNVIIKIPTAEETRQAPNSPIERKARRNTYGNLVYTINEVNNSIANSNKKQYGEGDILDFAEIDDKESIDIPRGKRVEHRHNLNELDTEAIGLDKDDIEKFNSDVYDKKEELEEQYRLIRQDVENIEINLEEIQKNINESNKALNAIIILGDKELEDKINTKKTEYELQVDILTKQHKEKTQQVALIVDDLNKIDMVAI